MLTLFVIRGPDEGKRFELNTQVVTIGRDTGNTIRLHDTEVSRRHAEFRATENGYTVTDLRSSNGTYVNNEAIRHVPLRPGDQIQVGQTILMYSSGGIETPAASDLADKINMISKADVQAPSAIVKAIGENEGSRLLTQPEQADRPWLKNALANLSVMYQATQAVSHILDLDQLLERIMDLIFQTIQAERGCIMLRNRESGEFEPKAVRWRAGVDQQEKISISRTIMDYVLREELGVLVADAMHDERFAAGQSIVNFGIHEALCVPMKGRHETLGVLYLDTRTPPQKVAASEDPTSILTEDHLLLAIAIGHQAALAVEETRYYQAMMQAERLAAVGQTIAAISHHVKNILQGLKSGSDLVKMGITDRNEGLLLQGWRVMEKNQARIYDLVMDMLSYSKEREPALEPTNLNIVACEVLELVQGNLKDKGIRLQTRYDDRLPIVQADPEGIHRAFLNLVSNAIDALDGRESPSLSVTTSQEADGQWVRLAVTDNGVGIPPEKLEDIFKPFISSKGSKGTGLGLAVSRKILREHGGDILGQSQPGKGSRFILRLPVHNPLSDSGGLGQTVVPGDDEPPLLTVRDEHP